MSVTRPVAAQFEAYNKRDINAFIDCFPEDFRGYRMPAETPSTIGKSVLREFYISNRFNNPELRAELISRTVLGNKVFDHEIIHGISPTPLESIAVFEITDDLISTAWFYFP